MIPSHSFPESTTTRRQQQIRPTSRRQLLAASGAAAVATALAACTGNEANIRSGVDQVTCLTSFGTFGRDAYPFVAKERDFFADNRLDVTVEPGGGTTPNLQLLGERADFAMIDLSGAIIARGLGNTGHIALAAVHQLAPAALMTTHPDITGARDLPGRTVGLAPGAILELLFPAYAELAGIDPGEVRIEPVDPPNLISVLAAGQVPVIEQFAMGLPTVQAAVGGRDVSVLPYSEYLTDLYGVVLVTTPDLARQQPELCARFRDALLQGLDYSLDHPDEAGQILAAAVDTADAAVAAAELAIMDSYSRVPATPIGAIDEVRVAQSIALLEGIGAIPAGLTAQEVVDFALAPAA